MIRVRLLSLLPLALVWGCGDSGYEAGLNQQVASSRQSAPFMKLNKAATLIEGTNFSIRLPLVFTTLYNQASGHPADNGPIKPERLNPPFLPLPGLKFCCEATINEAGGSYPYYCYVAADPVAPAGQAAFEADLVTKLRATFPEAAWQTVDATTPAGETVQWKRITVKGDQDFFIGPPPARKLSGQFDLWLREGQQGVVMLAWRVPDNIAVKANLTELETPTAGSLAPAGAGQPAQ